MLDFASAYALAIAVETVALFLLLRKEYRATLIVRNSIIANTLTLPFVWFAFPLLPLSWFAYTALAELFAFSAEATAYKLLFKKMVWKKAVLVSLVCNLLSLAAGLIL
jgi:hypothetical protein